MHVVMKFNGGLLDGSYEFEDNDDVASRIDHTQDPHLRVAMMLYHQTHKGQVTKVAQAMFGPAIGEELADLQSAANKYQVVKRSEGSTKDIVEIVAQYDPPEDASDM